MNTLAILDLLLETVFIVDSMKNMVDLIRMVLFFDIFVFSRTKMAKYMDKEQSEDGGSIETVPLLILCLFIKQKFRSKDDSLSIKLNKKRTVTRLV